MADPFIGKQLGDYVIRQLLGRGGMARVYMGYDERLQRYAAVKVINNDLSSVDETEYTERFRREARAIARLHHPNIVGVYQFGEYEGSYYMAMVFIEGQDLRQILREYNERKERLPLKDVLNIVQGIGSALDYAHVHGVIHRDIKPSNIMIDADEQPVLTDFGLALSTWEGTLGDTFGSAHYIAPEQAVSSAKAVPQSDLYSLGICVYEMLTGKVPFDDPSAMSVALKHLNEQPPPPSTLVPDLPSAIEEVVLKSLSKDPEQRYATGADMTQALALAIAGGDTAQTPLPPTFVTAMKLPEGFSLDSAKSSKPEAVSIPEPSTPPETPIKRPKPLPAAPPETPPAPPVHLASVETKPSILLRPKTETRAAKNTGVILLAVISIVLIVVVLALITSNRGGAGTATTATEKTGLPVAMGSAKPTQTGTASATNSTKTTKVPTTVPTTVPATASTATTASTVQGSLVKITTTSPTKLAVTLSPDKPVVSPTLTSTSTVTSTTARTATLTKTLTPTKTNSLTKTLTPSKTLTLTKTFTLTSTVTPSLTPTATLTPTGTATSTPTLTSTATTIPSETPMGTPAPTSTEPDVVLLYTSDQLNLINGSSRYLNLIDLVFVQHSLSEERKFYSTRWDRRGAVYAPSNLPPDWCFQVGRVDIGQRDPFPECRSLSAFLLASKPNWFWVAADDQTKSFDVMQGDRILATCKFAEGVCRFNLP